MPKSRPKTTCSARGRARRPRQRSSEAISQRLRIAADLATQTLGDDTSPAAHPMPPRDPTEPTVQLNGPSAHDVAADPHQGSQPIWPGHPVPDIDVPFPTSAHQTAATARPTGDNDPLLMLNANEIDIFVSNQIKEKIWNGQFVDLALLLKGNVQTQSQEQQVQFCLATNQFTIKPQSKIKKIENIESWTDAFVNFVIIYIQRHPNKAVELLKYMSIVREASVLNPFQSCYQYDVQFRLRMAYNPSRSWSNIDGHLWLTCSLFGTSSSQRLSQSSFSSALGSCFDYNFKGECLKPLCKYAHVCLRCKAPHPVSNCSKASNFVAQGPMVNSFQSRPQFGRRYSPYHVNNRFVHPGPRAPFNQVASNFRAFNGKR